MTPAPRNPCFRHELDDDAVRSKPVPTDPNGRGYAEAVAAERSLAGNTNGTASKQPLIICDRIEKSLLPLKKRATSDTSSDGSFVIPPKKRRADTGSDGASAYGVPVVQSHHQYDTVTVCSTAASPKPSGSSAITTVTSQPPQRQQKKKLMHDGIRSGGVAPWHDLAACNGHTEEQAGSSAAGAARAKKNTNSNRSNRNTNSRNNNRDAGVTLPHRPLPPGEELRGALAALGVTDADVEFVCMKILQRSDVDRNQNRLLFSCKREFVEDHAITALFDGNEREIYFVNECEPGLRLCALDASGTEFTIKLRYLESNGGYRLITGWGAFVEANNLYGPVKRGRVVDVELWAFRSRELPEQPELTDKNKRRVAAGLEDHPDGALGILLIPYVDGEERRNVRPAGEELERASPPPVHRTKKRRASAKQAAREEKKPADRVRANRGKAVARQMTLEEMAMVAGQEVADSLIGLLMLSSCRSSDQMLTLDNTTHRSSSATM